MTFTSINRFRSLRPDASRGPEVGLFAKSLMDVMDAFSKSNGAGGSEMLPELIRVLRRATMTKPGNADERAFQTRNLLCAL
jgi:hypothetical protein